MSEGCKALVWIWYDSSQTWGREIITFSYKLLLFQNWWYCLSYSLILQWPRKRVGVASWNWWQIKKITILNYLWINCNCYNDKKKIFIHTSHTDGSVGVHYILLVPKQFPNWALTVILIYTLAKEKTDRIKLFVLTHIYVVGLEERIQTMLLGHYGNPE